MQAFWYNFHREGGFFMETIAQIISQLGFPIAVACVCFWYINKQQEQHKQEIDKLSEAVNNNTLVIQKLLDKWENP